MVLFRKKKESDVSGTLVQLTIVEGNNDTNNGQGKVFDLHPGNNFIGRDQICEVTLNSGTVSRRHANLKVSYDKKKFSIADLDSSNGVIIKPSIILKKEKKPINSGDEIQIGEILLKFMVSEQGDSFQTMAVDVKDLLKQLEDKEKS
ncbi:MAG: FHA domain-containing protein [Candidatus Aminicenantes bacterium]|nr:MAG: FHA domain-containing protein [Candidatus Aminicenantes bacterium]